MLENKTLISCCLLSSTKIKLSGMTNAQRRSAAKIGFQYITEMAYEYKKPITPKAKEQAKRVLNDLGVADSRMEQFVDYVLSFNDVKRKNKLRDFAIGADAKGKAKIDGKLELPTAEDVMDDSGEFNDMGLQLAVSVMRFTDQSIQDPRTQDRPMYAEHPIGRLVYGIMSFVYSFQDKVLKAMVRRTAREYDISRTTGQAKQAQLAALLYMQHLQLQGRCCRCSLRIFLSQQLESFCSIKSAGIANGMSQTRMS